MALDPSYTPLIPQGTPTPPPSRARGLGRFGASILVRLLIFGVLAGGASILYATGILSNVEAPDYPGAHKSALTAAGKDFANNLYEDKTADTAHMKVFVTSDKPDTVATFYKTKLAADGWTAHDEDNGDSGAFAAFDKGSHQLLLLTGIDQKHWVANTQDTDTFVLLFSGDKDK